MPESASIHLCAAGPRSPIPKRPGRLVGWRRIPDDLVSFTSLILACREQFGQTADGMLTGMPFVPLLVFAVGLWVVLCAYSIRSGSGVERLGRLAGELRHGPAGPGRTDDRPLRAVDLGSVDALSSASHVAFLESPADQSMTKSSLP